MAAGITIRPLGLHELAEADALLQAAYGGGSRAARLGRYLPIEPGGWFAAAYAGALIGMGGALRYDNFAYLGLMAVHPLHQRQGLGERLTQHILAWLDRTGCRCVLLDASAAGEPLYAKLGFVADEGTALLHAKAPPSAVLPAACEPLDDLDAVAAFDAMHFGAERKKLLEALLRDFPGRAFVTRHQGALTGYVLSQENVIGPWLATSPSSAESLLQAALSLERSEAAVVMTPTSNTEALALLAGAGFTVTRTLRHMRRGGVAPPGNRRIIFGRASFAAG